MIMSGVDDGKLLSFAMDEGDGLEAGGGWVLSVGRRDDNDICLRHDTYSSRYHARLHHQGELWLLEDCNSKNGTFIEATTDDERVTGTIVIRPGQLFRIGRTWLRIQG
jgi:pSer/pThr/pTyr-binding forkhead associated (FHA) protein